MLVGWDQAVLKVRISTKPKDKEERASRNVVCTRNEMSTNPRDAGEPPVLGCLDRVEPVDRIEGE